MSSLRKGRAVPMNGGERAPPPKRAERPPVRWDAETILRVLSRFVMRFFRGLRFCSGASPPLLFFSEEV